MSTATSATATSGLAPGRTLWAGRILGGLVVLFLILDGIMHVASPVPVVQAMTELQIPVRLAAAIGVLELVCTALYVIPATSILGAVLLTGYLGGAVAVHMRVGNPIFEAYVFPIIVGTMIWGALLLRDARLRRLIAARG